VADLGLVLIVAGLGLMLVSGLLVSAVRSGVEYGYGALSR
jgi:hypothetical protein